jgi:hypothetical protein
VEGTAKGDHTRTASSTRYLDGVFDGFGTGAEKAVFLAKLPVSAGSAFQPR